MFLVCGEALFDVFVSGPAGTDRALTMRGVPGGSPFNVAIGLARLGAPVGLLAGISTDALGQQLVARLRAEGVSDHYIRPRPEPTTLSLVSLRGDGAPDYTFYGRGGADTALTAQEMPALGPEILGLHVGSYALVVSPMADALPALVAQAAPRLVTLDPNVRAGIVADPAAWRARIEALLASVAAVKVSDEDLAALWPGRELEAVAADWLGRGVRLVLVTRGRKAVVAFHGTARFCVVPPRIEVIDTVGAGDAFQSALIDGLLRLGVRTGDDLSSLSTDRVRHVVERCAWAGAITCMRSGAEPPLRTDLPIGLSCDHGTFVP